MNPALRRSRFRSQFRLEDEDLVYIDRRGLASIEVHARDFIRRRLAEAHPRNDGKQTPFKGHPVFKAQHATATCCRGCLEKWYGIKKGRALTAAQTGQIATIILHWIEGEIKLRRGS